MRTTEPLIKLTVDQLEAAQLIAEGLHELSNSNLRDALQFVLKVLHDKLRMQRGMISILQRGSKEISSEVSFGMDVEGPRKVKYSLGEGVTGKVIESGRSIAIPRLDEAPFFLDRTGARKHLARSELAFICVPIMHGGRAIGALSVDRASTTDETLLEKEVAFLELTAKIIASCVFQYLTDEENARLKRILSRNLESDTIVGNSNPIKEMIFQVRQVADSTTTVLITGETGTGKELVARELHKLSSRMDKPLIMVNCGAIPEHLVESELFGHEKGAFTGAIERRIGKFELANHGTIFLDEIGELPLMTQVKLLRVIQEKEIERVGGKSPIKTDVRIVTATNRNLEIEVADGNFREDLFYRINVFHIHVPPLRKRGSDILLLADYFTEKYAKNLGKTVSRLDTPAIDMLMAYHWPGNVRELENCIERAVLISRDNVIHAHHLPPSLQMESAGGRRETSDSTFEALTQNYEIELLTNALKDCAGNQTMAARALGITKRIIQYKIQKYNIDYKRFRDKG